MGRKIEDRPFWESALVNNQTFRNFYMRLFSLAISRFQYKNLPESVDRRFMELALYFKVLVDRPMICKDEKQKDPFCIPPKGDDLHSNLNF